MASLTPEQRRVLRTIRKVGSRKRATPMELKAAVETGLVETDLRNLSYGDGTSVGWRQETKSSYPTVNRRNVEKSVERFFDEVRGQRGKYGTAGQLAQAVQRSAYPDRYGKRSSEAEALLRGSTPKAGSGYGAAKAAPPSDSRQAIALSLLGFGNLSGDYGGGDPLTSALIQAKQSAIKPQSSSGYANAPSGTSGRLLGRPADRAGAHTSKPILSFVGKVAGVYGHPVRLGTGTAHNRLTVNGNVSAHWAGNALDLPAVGKKNLALGRAALVAAGMPQAQARKAKGGIYNIGGKQIIFQTNQGGNHFNHVHVGLR